jgi:hypothetical protein
MTRLATAVGVRGIGVDGGVITRVLTFPLVSWAASEHSGRGPVVPRSCNKTRLRPNQLPRRMLPEPKPACTAHTCTMTVTRSFRQFTSALLFTLTAATAP